MSTAQPTPMQRFAVEAMQTDDVSVSLEEDHAVLTITAHDGAGEIDTSPVHAMAQEAGLVVRGAVADFGAGEVRVEVGHVE